MAGTANKAYDVLHAAMQMQEGDARSKRGVQRMNSGIDVKGQSERTLDTDQFVGAVTFDVAAKDVASAGAMHLPGSGLSRQNSGMSDTSRASPSASPAGGGVRRIASTTVRTSFKGAANVVKATGTLVGMAKDAVQDALHLASGKQKLFPSAKSLHQAFSVLLLCNNLYIATWTVNLASSTAKSFPCTRLTLVGLVCTSALPLLLTGFFIRPKVVLKLYKVMAIIYPNFQVCARALL